MSFVLASANPDKAAEIRALLEPLGIDLVARPSEVAEVEETGVTLEENALLKAHALAQATQLPAIADDTGLEIDGLGGAPGVYAARFAGEHATYADNVAKVLADLVLSASGTEGRRARFATVAAVAWPDGRELTVRGEVEGVITDSPRGSSGFGYDPIFAPEGGGGRTFAEMSTAEKEAISHRGRAFRLLASSLADHLG
ncbi:MAG: RdgB/HAM1 family non-canonical purine NTP pyrophosphatase [Actinomycetota bacterium]